MATPDMDVIKEIPGYKVILKAVLKSQIQQLVEQLASHTDEESVILTASVSDGTLSHLGSDSGKNFLDDHEDIKSQFLGFCLKRHHRKKVQQQQQTPPMRSQPWPTHLGQGPGPRPRMVNRPTYPRQNIPRHPLSVPSSLSKNVRHEPYPVSKPQRRSVDSNIDIARPAPDVSGETSPVVKVEPDDSSEHSGNDGESSSAQGDNSIPNEGQGNSNQTLDSNAPNESSDSNNASDPLTSTGGDVDPNVNIKVEAISESDMELEITGVELGNNSDPIGSQKDMWSPNTSIGYDPSGAIGSPGDMQPNYSYGSHHVRRYPCSFCGKDFATKQILQRHIRLHTGERPYKCEHCSKCFTQKGHLQSHMITHMPNIPIYQTK